MNQEASSGIPVTWPVLIAECRMTMPDRIEGLDELVQAVVTAKTSVLRLREFVSAAQVLPLVAVVSGPSTANAVLQSLNPYLESVIELAHSKGNRPVAWLGLLHYVDVCQCCGVNVTVGDRVVEVSWLQRIVEARPNLTREELVGAAMACLGLGQPELVPQLIGGGKLPTRFVPGEKFEFNVEGFIRYVAVAIRDKAEPEAVDPAWRSFLAAFPRKLATKTLTWTDLLWAARAMMEQIEGRPVGGTAQALHDLVT